MPDLLCIGHATYDTFLKVDNAQLHCDINNENCLVCFGFGVKVPVSEIHYGVGGGASNTAVGCKKLGIHTAIFTIVGSDSRGTDIAANLMSKGVDTTYIHMDNDVTDQSSIVSYSEERTIFTYSEDREYRLDTIGEHYPYVYLSSVGRNVDRLYKDVIDMKAKNPNMVLFYNPGSKELRDCHDEIEQLLPHVDYLIVNVEEGCQIVNNSMSRLNVEVDDLSNMLTDKGITNVILTDGENGVYLTTKTDHLHIPAIKTEVIEKTGAGDAFAAGFISAIIHGKPILEACQWGIINGAAVMREVGAQNGILDLEQMEKELEAIKTENES